MFNKIYHVTFLNSDNNISSGKRYEAVNEIKALNKFREEYPNAVFLYIASEEMFNYKY